MNVIAIFFLRLEIPGNIDRIIERKTNPKTEKYRGIIIKSLKKGVNLMYQKLKM